MQIDSCSTLTIFNCNLIIQIELLVIRILYETQSFNIRNSIQLTLSWANEFYIKNWIKYILIIVCSLFIYSHFE